MGIVLPWPPFVPRVCQKGLGVLYKDWEDCIWIVRLYLDCEIAVFGTKGIRICIWIVRLYLDSTIVFGLCQLYLDCVNCIWIVSIVFGLYNCRFWYNGVQYYLHTPPPCDKKVVPKRILSIAFGLFRLYLDCVDYIWIVLIVCRPTALYRRQAGVQECIKGYTWSVWSKVELCRVQIAHQSCWLSLNCVDHRDFAKH